MGSVTGLAHVATVSFLASRLLDLGWIRRADRGRAVHVTDAGADGLQRAFRLSMG